MNRQILTGVIILASLATGCSKKKIEQDRSNCLATRIEGFKTRSLCNDASVKKYTFQKKTVYVFDNGSCGNDMGAGVVGEDCNNLGSLGGFAGNTTINGENFSSAVFVETVWQK
jgi:hypothetical protein